jgi:uncharacterized protein
MIAGSELPDTGDPTFAPYWAAAKNHSLVITRCGVCHTYRWPPRPICARCGSTEVEWDAVVGQGHVYSWTVSPGEVGRGHSTGGLNVIAIVELVDVPVRLLGSLRGMDRQDLNVGLPVVVDFERVADDVVLPVWRPAGSLP